MKLREFFKFINDTEADIDVYVDGIDGIAVCYPITITEEGQKHFADALELEVEDNCIMGEDRDYDALFSLEEEGKGDGGRLQLAWDLISGLAGYCSCSDYNRWFENK